jgi:hypothetical protein
MEENSAKKGKTIEMMETAVFSFPCFFAG